jgi:5-(carboxyamino)imidazole ribonucleotide synthase
MKQKMISPPAWIGILGGGQLGMMLATVAKQFGYQVAILEPDLNCPAARVADKQICTNYDDKDGLRRLAELCAVVTTEFENVPAVAIEQIAQTTPVYPSSAAIKIAQNRIQEKKFFQSIGLKTADFASIKSLEDCRTVKNNLFPAILKTTTLGYDGKGQVTVENQTELTQAYQKLGAVECILEKKVKLAKEVSIIVARNCHGVQSFPLIENQHRNGILDVSYIPAQVTQELIQEASAAAVNLVNSLDYVGLLTIEFFITQDQELLVNEIAPRPHNSGHITIESAITSQYEQQLRAICGLPLGSTELKQAGAMLNLLGDVWLDSKIDANQILLTSYPEAKFHWYGKSTAKPGRKMGHISLTDSDPLKLIYKIKQLKSKLNFSVE